MSLRLLLLAAAAFATAENASGFALTGAHWSGSSISMQLQLGPAAASLLDGSASWGASAEDALSIWNGFIGTTRFAVVRDSTAARAGGNRQNNVFFSSSVYGDAWGTGVLAITLSWTSAGQTAETDVLFNNTLNWDSYRGALRYGASGGVYDFHRVALHEFGHVLGLDHPDQAGQAVTAIMNSRISTLDALAADDISGAQSLYGSNATAASAPAPAPAPTPPPAPAPTPTPSPTPAPTLYAPIITSQPSDRIAPAGQSVTFSIGVSGTAPFAYIWRRNGAAIMGANQPSFTIPSVSASDAGAYSVLVSNSAGSAASVTATLTVAMAPSISVQPSNQVITVGGPLTLAVSALGVPAPTYVWFKDGVSIAGAAGPTFTIASVRPSDAGSYTVVVSNNAGTVTSATAVVAVNTPPVVSAAPVSQTAAAGDRVVLSVAASGTPAPTYQWQKNGMNLAGATQSQLILNSVASSDAGTYAVVVANAAGSVTTVPVLLTVNASQLVNLSARGYLPPGAALTAGFVVRGPADKAVLVRAIGPSLSGFGVNDALPDPQLAVIAQEGTQTLAVNDGWSQAPQLSATFQNVGAFPLPLGSADSASQLRLPAGAYTTRVTSDGATGGGVVLAEVYDADGASVRCRLVNLSTIGYTGPGDANLVAGFSIQGNAPKRVLLRAVGPGLTSFGVAGALTNPRLELYRAGGTTPLAANEDWGGTAELQQAFAGAGAFNLAPASRDAAIVTSLPPGGYTMIVSGVNGAAGFALAEIYDLDP